MSEFSEDVDYGFQPLLSIEDYWNDGIHRDREGNVVAIADMTKSHLENTIKYFRKLDTSALKAELSKRK